MEIKVRHTLTALLCFFLSLAVLPLSAQSKKEKSDSLVRLMKAESIQQLMLHGQQHRKAVASTFLHNGTYLISDTALWNVETKVIKATGHVKVIQDETVLTSDKLDYYIDDKDCIMPNSHYTSDLIIATGNISQKYAIAYLSTVAKTLMANHLWSNQIEQINVLPNRGIELVPRVGNHIIHIGQLPGGKNKEERTANTVKFVTKQMDRLEKFYKYGLSQAGWDKYSYINLEFENQIICKRRKAASTAETAPAVPKPTAVEAAPAEKKSAETKPTEKKPTEKKQ